MREEQDFATSISPEGDIDVIAPRTPENNKLREARSYLKLGFTPIRAHHPLRAEDGSVRCSCGAKNCKTPGKHPFGAWTRYQTWRPSDSLIGLWFNATAHHNVGLVHGAAAGTIVLDWDGAVGLETRKALEAERGPLPPCPVVVTPGGGQHQLFRHPGVAVPTRRGLRLGFDVRADGGFSIAPPSSHQNGGSYRWQEGCHPTQIQLPNLPQAWIEIVTERSPVSALLTGVATSLNGTGLRYDLPEGTDELKIVDGREEYMRNTVAAVLRDLCRSHGRLPTSTELFDAGWPQYERKVDLTKPGRGADEFRDKCEYTCNRAAQGAFPDLHFGHLESEQVSGQTDTVPTSLLTGDLPVMTTAEAYALPPPKWLIPNLMIRDTLALLYGPPGSLKSFFALDIGLSVAHGLPWGDKAVEKAGVAYIAAEGATGLGMRCAAWERHHGVIGTDNLFRLIPTTVNLREPVQVERLIARLRDVGTSGDFQFGLVIFDTVARSMVGGDENSAQEVGVVMDAATTIRRALGCTVLMVHHTGKDQKRGMRGSNRFLADADTTLEVERKDAGRQFTVTVKKQKDAEDGQKFCLLAEKVDLPLRPGRGVEGSLVVVPDPNDPATQADRKREADRQSIAAVIPVGKTVTVSKVATLVGSVFNMGRGTGLYERITAALPMDEVFTVHTNSGLRTISRTPTKGQYGQVTSSAVSDAKEAV